MTDDEKNDWTWSPGRTARRAVTRSTAAAAHARKDSTLPQRSAVSGAGAFVLPEPAVIETDIAIIGSGGAGLLCALAAADADPNLSITIVSKGAVGRSGCTRMVQGGFNAAMGPLDSLDAHFRDTLVGGAFLNDQEMAWALVEGAPAVIDLLESRVGCLFDRNAAGALDLKPFGGQTFDRTVHRADQTGLEIMGRLRDQMFRIGARELEDCRALDLVFDRHGELAGLTLLDTRTGEPAVLLARTVVVATGGGATMYKIAAPAREKTGDGVALCFRAGLELRDMEMLQFHPTGLVAGASAPHRRRPRRGTARRRCIPLQRAR